MLKSSACGEHQTRDNFSEQETHDKNRLSWAPVFNEGHTSLNLFPYFNNLIKQESKDGKTAGLGAFYWEGTWNGLMDVSSLSGDKRTGAIVKERKIWDSCGCGWTSSYSHDYDPSQTNGTAGGCVIDNQSFFGPDGKALQSLKAFSKDYDGTETIDENLDVSDVKVGDSDEPLELDPDTELTSDLFKTRLPCMPSLLHTMVHSMRLHYNCRLYHICYHYILE